ncbi:MAG: corrinoid protein [Desulfarculales bacterium]|jgi:corrinoid protein of di/trimethylamine methyltransferase|nr:corrinoid protein [Desulfarculales bacterium]
MAKSKEILFQELSDSVVEMEENKAADLAREVVEEKIDAYEAIDKGLAHGMERAGRLFEEDEYFVPELLIAADAMYAGIEVLRQHIAADSSSAPGRIVIGVVEGDTHDIGKNLVKIILEAKGFEVHDLGRDVPPSVFVAKAKEIKADIIGLSTLMTTTMAGMARVIEMLHEAGLRERIKVMIGGAPISQGFARKIGADGYSANAMAAGDLALKLLAQRRILGSLSAS